MNLLRSIIILLLSKLNIFNRSKILIIPATILDGGFGDEIMVYSCIKNFSNKEVTLYTQKIIKRDDLFKNFKNFEYLSWKEKPKYYRYSKIVLLGADNLSGTYGNKEVLDKFKLLEEAHNHKLSIYILGFSLSENISPVVEKEMKRIIRFSQFFLRDPDSYQRAKNFLPENKLKLVADVAFNCPLLSCSDTNYLEWTKEQKKFGNKIIAVCPNSIHSRSYNVNLYAEEYAQLLINISKKQNVAFVLLYHDLRLLNKLWNDKKIAELIYEKISSILNSYYTAEIKNGVELKSFLPFLDGTFTSRMHLGISGYSVGKPMFGITYENKFSGLQKMFHLPPDKTLVEYTNLSAAEDHLNDFIINIDYYSKLVQNNIGKIKKLSDQNFI